MIPALTRFGGAIAGFVAYGVSKTCFAETEIPVGRGPMPPLVRKEKMDALFKAATQCRDEGGNPVSELCNGWMKKCSQHKQCHDDLKRVLLDMEALNETLKQMGWDKCRTPEKGCA